MTLSPQQVLHVIDALNGTGARYIVTGSLAVNLYCTPRSTLDADFVVEMSANELERLFAALGSQFEREPQMAFETVTGKTQHRFRHKKTKFLIEFFEARMDDEHEKSRFKRRRAGLIEDRTAFIPTAEDVVVQKLRWFKRIRRAKDREDARNVLIHQWNNLDWSYIEGWCSTHETSPILEELRREAMKLIHSA